MQLRTHLAIVILGILLFFSLVEQKTIFVVVALIASIFPDLDSAYSTFGKKKVFRFFQIFVKHRGFIHSFTFALLITLFFVIFVPVLAFGFFLGYGLHLFADSFTKDGIAPFYPMKKKTSWKIVTGGKSEIGIFLIFVVVDLALVIFKIGF